MNDDAGKVKRKAKSEDGPEKKQKLEATVTSFEVQPEVENFQREALWRSLQDYKRRGIQSQEQLEKLQRTAQYHDDHLRLVDVWWDQLLDEIQIMSHDRQATDIDAPFPLNEQHFFASTPEFAEHLTEKRQYIMNSILNAVKHLRSSTNLPPDITTLQDQNRDLSARLKLAQMSVKKLEDEKVEREPKIAELQERLASSQRKVDRQKSITLARIEAQARRIPSDIASGPRKATAEDSKDVVSEHTSTSTQISNGVQLEGQAELSASNERLLSELNELQSRLASIIDQNTSLNSRLEHLKESDIEHTESYQALKIASEHLRGQNEHLEQLGRVAMQETSKLQAERTEFRNEVVKEHQTQFEDIVAQLAKSEHDLARVRSARDELHSSLQLRKAQDDARAASARELSELADTQATRIAALEAEVTRLKLSKTDLPINGNLSNGETSHDSLMDLARQVEYLRKENESLKNELPTMEQAFNQAHEQNTRQVMDLVAAEEKLSRLQAEKSKADQKYFAAMKTKDQLSTEIKALKSQTSKSSDTVARLHDAEESTKRKLTNVEQQVATLEQVCNQYKLELSRKTSLADTLRLRADENTEVLSKAIKRIEGKEHELAALTSAKRHLSEELEVLRAQYQRIKATESQALGSSGESDQIRVYRGMAMCSVCNTRWKDTTLTSCGHVFCKECVDKRVETRQRRCPSCNKGFGTGDVLSIHL